MYRKKEGSWDPLSYPATRWVGARGGPTFRARKAGWVAGACKEGKVFLGTCYNWRRACEYGQVVRHLVSHTQEKLICQWRRCYLPSLAPGIVQRSNERRWKCMASWNVCAGQSLTPPRLTDTLNSSSHTKPQTSSVSICILRFASKKKLFSSSRRKVINAKAKTKTSENLLSSFLTYEGQALSLTSMT